MADHAKVAAEEAAEPIAENTNKKVNMANADDRLHVTIEKQGELQYLQASISCLPFFPLPSAIIISLHILGPTAFNFAYLPSCACLTPRYLSDAGLKLLLVHATQRAGQWRHWAPHGR